MKDFWSYAILKAWKKDIYARCLTHDDYMGKALVENHDSLIWLKQDPGLEPEDCKIVRMQKDNQRYLLPTMFEDQLPAIISQSFECQLKPSDKVIYKYVRGIKSMNIPADRMNHSFKQFIDSFNPVEHTSHTDWIFLVILAIASKYKSVKCAVCSEPGSGKNANFMVLHHILDKCPRLSGPTPARMYQAITNNDVVVIDELTSIKADLVREIEGMVLQLGDNSTEYIKHSQTVGRQLKEADLIKKSIIFTYNRTTDIGKRATFFDDKWNNPAAFKSRYPQFLLQGKVVGDAPVYSYSEITQLLTKYSEEIKTIAKQVSYWTQNINLHLHHWNQDKLRLKGRHKTNLSGLIDALDAYSETQQEFDTWCEFVNTSLERYKAMVRGEDIEEKPVVEHIKYNPGSSTLAVEQVEEDIL